MKNGTEDFSKVPLVVSLAVQALELSTYLCRFSHLSLGSMA